MGGGHGKGSELPDVEALQSSRRLAGNRKHLHRDTIAGNRIGDLRKHPSVWLLAAKFRQDPKTPPTGAGGLLKEKPLLFLVPGAMLVQFGGHSSR